MLIISFYVDLNYKFKKNIYLFISSFDPDDIFSALLQHAGAGTKNRE